MNMRDRKTINTLTLSQPVNDQVVELVLCLFSNHSFEPGNRRFSFSVAGKIKGLSCIEGIAKITADYNSRTKLTDDLSIVANQFVYSNQSITPLSLEINLRLNGALSWQGLVDIAFQIKLHYSLKKITVHTIHSSYKLKGKTKSKFALMQ